MTSNSAADDPQDSSQTPGVELDGVDVALERVHRAWDAGLQGTRARLDHLVAQTDEALRLT
ncbi:hypothetical protein [Umezawaea sp. Da 62-37]|uniref:hypothetical protein n=1 Tax=Umezawaea sp. Da 62-37 TaxID=3075927 RepID=UPI0028F70556|nr:hypothetical protein [Umezawaea sp. Da 62-37]WNV82924.1 hypothetical protein RM788_32625 [Umezawaea sp. Da 62-37]